jgi:hypothetical protein
MSRLEERSMGQARRLMEQARLKRALLNWPGAQKTLAVLTMPEVLMKLEAPMMLELSSQAVLSSGPQTRRAPLLKRAC